MESEQFLILLLRLMIVMSVINAVCLSFCYLIFGSIDELVSNLKWFLTHRRCKDPPKPDDLPIEKKPPRQSR